MEQEVGAGWDLSAAGNSEGGPPSSRLREPSALPETEIAIVRMSGVSGEQLEQRSPLVSLTGRCVETGFVLPLPFVYRVGDKSHPRVGREAGRSEGHQPLPRTTTRHDPARRREVRADNERHAEDL
jgi:hypothetical protein